MATYTGSDKRLQYLFRASGNLAEDYNDTSTYAVGDFAIVDGVLKKCITAVSTPESYDSTKWTNALITDEMGGGGGGTTVIANPSGTPTDDLETIQIGSTIYDIVGGGGSGTGVIKDVLWESANGQSFANNSPYSATLDKNISDYDLLIFSIEGVWANVRAEYFALVSNIDKTGTIKFGSVPVYGAISSNYTIFAPSIGYTDETHLSFATASSAATLKLFKIVGLKFGSAIELASCYSTEEKQVGCWTDGKPLYQKTLHLSGTASSNDYNINETLDATFEIKHILDGGCWRGGTLFNPSIYPPQPIWYRYAFDPSSHILNLRVGNSNNNAIEAYVTIQYTKTTDTAGSGIWTPSGSYAVHYSETEHVIGTWIDGKPLYEITIDGGALPSGTSKTITTPANIKRVIDFEGVAYNDADDRPLPFSANNNNEIRVDRAQGVLRIITFATWNGYSFYLTIRYTKTTD